MQAAKVKLQINETKTEYMVVNRLETAGVYPSLNIRNYVFNRTKQFKYLGSVLMEKNEIENKTSARILADNRSFYGLVKLLGSLLRELKIQQYNTLLRPVITYRAETWPLQKVDERKLIVLERKILTTIYEPVKDINSNEWKIRTNNERELIFHKSNILHGNDKK